MKSAFPKILVATSFPPDAPGGSAWLLYQLLRGVPPDRVSWWSSSGQAPPHSVERVGSFKSGHLPPRLVPQRRYTQIKAFLLEQIWVPLAARGLRAYIKAEKPDLLWILGYSWSIPVLHRAIRWLGIPWHITVHDLADSVGLVSSLGANRATRFQRMVDDLYAGAVSRDVYMQETGDEMERTTGTKADLIIRCGAEPEEIESIRTKNFLQPQEKIRIGYPGTIIAEDTFARFIAALQLIRVELPVEVNLFGVHSYRDRPWFDDTLIVEHGYLSEEEFDRRYLNCNWGLAIMELDDSNPRYSRFTFPCKFTRALAAGLPVISIGHPECTLTRFASQYQLGLVMTSSEPKVIADALQSTFSKPQGASQLRKEILRCVNSEFNAGVNRKNLHKLFQEGAIGANPQRTSELGKLGASVERPFNKKLPIIFLSRFRGLIFSILNDGPVSHWFGSHLKNPVHSGGFLIELPPDATPALRTRLFFNIYERPEIKLIKKWLPADIACIELGGSIGVTTLHALKKLNPERKLISVEAFHHLAEVARRNICSNNLARANVIIEEGCIFYDAGAKKNSLGKIFSNKCIHLALKLIQNIHAKHRGS